MDVYGQERVDDSNTANATGIGSNIFKDIGAIERADFAGPTVRLSTPLDNGSLDSDPDLTEISINNPALLTQFVISITDPGTPPNPGVGVSDTVPGLVDGSAFVLTQTDVNGVRVLQSGIDYIYTYNSNTNEAIFRSVTVFPSEAAYNITVADPTQLVDIAGNQVQPNRTDGSVQFDILVTEGANDPPTIDVPGPQVTIENTNGNGSSITFSRATGNAITIDDPFIAGNIVQLTLSGDNGTITLPAGFGALATLNIGTGTNDAQVRLTGTIDNLNQILDGVIFTPTVDVNTEEGGPPPMVTLNVSVNDLGNFSAENPPNQQITNDSVGITVTAVNTAPSVTTPAMVTTAENSNFNFTAGDTVSVADPDVGDMLINLTVTNGTLSLAPGEIGDLAFTVGDGTADSAMTFTGTVNDINEALAGLVFTPNTSFTGTAVMTLVIDDQNNSGAGSTPNATATTTITVTEVNDPPILRFNGNGPSFDTDSNIGNGIADPSINVLSEGTFEFKPSTSSLISISDIDAGAGIIQVTLSTDDGTLTLATTAGLNFSFSDGNGTGAGDGTDDQFMRFRGTLAAINNALFNATDGGLRFNAPMGPATPSIEFGVNDLGNTGGGAQTDTGLIDVDVEAPDSNPRNLFEGGLTFPNGIPVQEGAPNATLVFDAASNRLISVSDADSANLTVTLTVDGGATLDLPNLAASGVNITDGDGDGSVQFDGTIADLNTALSVINFTSNGTNTSNFTIVSSDGGGTDDTDVIQITVNDAPEFIGEDVVDVSYDFMVNENAGTGIIVGTITAQDADVPSIDSLTFAITGGNALGGFAIVKTSDTTANIVVADPAVLDFETNPAFALTVTVTDSTGVLDTTTVNITLNDLPEQLVIDPTLWTNNGLTLLRVGNNIRIFDTVTGIDVVPVNNIDNVTDIIFQARDNVSDTLTIDFSGGNPIPDGTPAPGGISFDGGVGIGVDSLLLVDPVMNGVTSVTHDFAGGGAGTVTIDGTVITYSRLEPISDQLVVGGNRTFNFSGAADAVTLQDDGTAVDGVSQLVSPTNFSGFTFSAPTGSLTINLGAGADALTVAGLDDPQQAVIALGGADTDTLIGTDGVDIITVNATDAGTMVTSSLTTTFSQFESLDGRGDSDSFTVNDGITLSGSIAGGDGDDSFTILGTVGGNLDGGAGIDTLTFTGPGTGPGNVVGVISNIERAIVNGTNDPVNPDQIVVRLNAATQDMEVLITTNNVTSTQTFFQPPVTPVLTVFVNGLAGDDTLVIDHRNGFVDANVVLDGGAGADSIQVIDEGSATSTMTALYTPGNSTDNGTIVVQENGLVQTITFSGLTPVEFTGIAQATLRTPRSADIVTLAAAVGPTSGLSALEVRGTSAGTGFETFYASDVARVTVDLATADNAGTPVDTVVIEDGALAANEGLVLNGLTIQTGIGRDVINLQEDSYLTFGGEDALVIDAGGNTDRLNVNVSAATAQIDQITLMNDNLGLTVAGISAGVVSFLSPISGLSTLGGEDVTVSGGAGDNTFDLSRWSNGARAVINGQGGDDTLIGLDVDNNWTINGTNSGQVGVFVFNDVENLVGGTGNDAFIFSGGSLEGSVDGGATGIDSLSVGNTDNTWTIDQNGGGVVRLGAGVTDPDILYDAEGATVERTPIPLCLLVALWRRFQVGRARTPFKVTTWSTHGTSPTSTWTRPSSMKGGFLHLQGRRSSRG